MKTRVLPLVLALLVPATAALAQQHMNTPQASPHARTEETVGITEIAVDYHRPARWHQFRPVMKFILRHFEPFAMDLWAHEVREWLPALADEAVRKETFWGGLYQKLVIRA